MIYPTAVMALSPTEWARLAVALILFLGPGYGLLSFHPRHRDYDVTQTMTLSIGLSIAFWSVLLAWLHAFRVVLTPLSTLIILSAGWLLGLMRARPWRWTRPGLTTILAQLDRSRLLLWGVLALSAGVSLWALRHAVAGLGSDSYHHTLIAQMIVDRGMLPDNYEPYAPIVTFTYHFGFHGVVAAMAWLTGLTPLVLTPIMGQILMAVAALSVAYFTEVTTRDKWAATVSAAIAGLISVFPAFFVNWGRDTQLTGLVMLPLFMGILWEWAETDHLSPPVPLIGLLAAGIALVHYRVTLMAASGVVVLMGLNEMSRGIHWPRVKQLVGGLIVAALIATLLTAPWVWVVLSSGRQGYAVDLGKPALSAFMLSRLGDRALYYPNNWILIGLVFAAILTGIWLRERLVMGLTLWSVVMLVASGPRFAGVIMDTVSVVVSLYFPAAVAIGWWVGQLVARMRTRWRFAPWIAGLAMAALSLRGILAIANIADPDAAYVGAQDLPAMAWIKSHTPPSARFMVNTFHWDFLPEYVIGSDAGYWLPLLARRATVTAPMTYSAERVSRPDFAARLAALDRLGGHLTSPEALALLQRAGITHVYAGQRGGPIVVEELLRSPAFALDYQQDAIYVFRFLGAQSP